MCEGNCTDNTCFMPLPEILGACHRYAARSFLAAAECRMRMGVDNRERIGVELRLAIQYPWCHENQTNENKKRGNGVAHSEWRWWFHGAPPLVCVRMDQGCLYEIYTGMYEEISNHHEGFVGSDSL